MGQGFYFLVPQTLTKPDSSRVSFAKIPVAEHLAGIGWKPPICPEPACFSPTATVPYTEPHQIVAYFQAVAAASDRVLVEEYGRTYEHRPLIYAIVSAPENLMRLEAIRQANLQLSEDPGSVSDAALTRMPVVAYMGYSIHGNEASGSEAALLVLYYLAAARGPAIDSLLAQAVLLIDPMLNPDGRDRFVDWVNRNRGRVPVADPQN